VSLQIETKESDNQLDIVATGYSAFQTFLCCVIRMPGYLNISNQLRKINHCSCAT